MAQLLFHLLYSIKMVHFSLSSRSNMALITHHHHHRRVSGFAVESLRHLMAWQVQKKLQ